MVVADAVQRLLRQAPSLGVLPAAYLRLSEVLRDPNCNAERIAAVVRLDPGFTASLLRYANSAASGSATRIDNVSQAATRIGTNQIANLALSTSVVKMFRGMPEHLLDMRSFWTHSVAVGFATSALARARGQQRTETLFVRGLLHDVGTLVMCVATPVDARRVLMATENTGRPHHVVEREMLGFSHADVGGALLQSWNFPEEAVSAVRFHHNPSNASPKYQDEADLVHLADVVVSAIQLGNGGERAACPLDAAAWERLGLKPAVIEAIVPRLEDQVATVVASLLQGA